MTGVTVAAAAWVVVGGIARDELAAAVAGPA
jgi:hypothetical protein